ncbi:hypothetical protein B0H17DRAFT_1209746 [Mycena rosella]|uniref:Uncharacterized protein n=1 Tax=Mycena rosella TaxID=1033263 RepID=A0AAD7CY79_MYCRO|nr:hypothetical protein B0H17DRAFT_1209746 [Mycena rosella]
MPATSSSTTHATRNPTQPVQKSRHRVGRPSGKLTPAQQAMRALQVAQRKLKQRELEEDIDGWFKRRDKFIEQVAERHDRTVDYIKALLTNPSQFKLTRAINIRNAVVHDLHLKAEARGEKIPLKELMHLADEVMLESLSPQDWDPRIQEEFMNLLERTGTRAVAFFSRGHVDDGFLPTYAESGESMDFYLQSTKIPGLDLLRRYELWCCNRDRAPQTRETLNGLRGQIKTSVTGGLQEMTKNPKLAMSYSNYLVAIQQSWKVKLLGWPTDIPFVNPSKIGTIDRVRRIRDGLRNGPIHWVYLQADEIADVNAEVKCRRTDGTLHAPRKPHADAGKKHKCRGLEENESSDEDDGDNDYGDKALIPGTSTFAAAAATPSSSSSTTASSSTPAAASSAAPTSTLPSVAAAFDGAPYVAPPPAGFAVPASFAVPAGFDDFDYNDMVLDFNALAADFGRYDAASDALQGLNSMSLGPTNVHGAYGIYPTTIDAHGAHPIVNVAGGAFPPSTSPVVPSPLTTPLGAANAGGFQFGALTTPASFSATPAPSERPVAKASKRRASADGAKRVRKPRSDKGKPRPKATAVENETPAEKAARMARKKAAALRKIASRAGRRA